MVARQLKIVSQNDAFTISATRNIQYVFKKLVCLIVFVKDIFDIHLNNIYNIFFSLHLVRKCLGEHLLYALPSNKNAKISQIFKYTSIVLPWKQNSAFKLRNLICLRVGLCMQNC